jgi:Short C-terminal domain
MSDPSTAEIPAAAAPASSSSPLSRGRRIAVWTLVVLASIIGLFSILTTFVNRQLLDDHAWQKASARVIQDPTVRNAVSVQLVNQLYGNVNVAAQLQSKLPKNLQQLAGPAAGALREPATKAVEYLLAQPRFQQLFIQASTVAHEKLINVLENKTGFGISTGNGEVTLDVSVLLQQLGAELGVPQSALDRLPPTAGQIKIMSSDQLSYAQAGVRTIKVLSTWLLVLIILLYALAMYLARGERRKTLLHIGWAFVLVGLLVLVVRRVVGNYVINSLAQPQYRPPTHHVWLILSAILGQLGWAVVFYGVLLVLGAALAGPSRISTALRRELAPVLNVRAGITWGVVAFIWLLLILWGGTHALRTWWGILFIGALMAAGVVALRKQTREEFPLAGTAEGAPTLGTRMAATAGSTARRASSSRSAVPETPARSPSEELARLAELRDKGAITTEEYDQAKKLALS